MKRISRKRALEDPRFASFISSWQQDSNPAMDSPDFDEGEYYDKALKEHRFFSTEELKERYEMELEDFKNRTDKIPTQKTELAGTLVIEAPEDGNEIHYITEKLSLLLKLHKLEFLFIPLFKSPWLNTEALEGHHPETIEAHAQLEQLIGDADYRDGFMISTAEDLEAFLPPYFNLIEGNFYAYSFFYSEQLKAVCSFHYSGEFWFYCFETDGLDKLQVFIDEYGLIKHDGYST